ncbi:helix-turn-helix domain-containing protein [Flavobacterium sandaracinum]|uniref:DNA-binding protein n=1 Tax=Flavobacterium sandaracinum TaxID=2541733 RepID=A0A4R5CYS0_9FLAO|nr:helix-turn-helix domain-containing protein [Flavobacterium sandaracinum]TDE04271.1 DNA-binding protein [Flavobacterium sandaracinum]
MTPENPTLFSHQLITKGDLVEFKNTLISELKEIISQNPEPKKWLKSAEVKELLKISNGTLQNLRINGTLDYTKVGSIIYYKYDDLKKLLEK